MSSRHSRRSFLKQTALGTTALAIAPSLVMGTRAAHAAKLALDNVHVEAAQRAKELAGGKPGTRPIPVCNSRSWKARRPSTRLASASTIALWRS